MKLPFGKYKNELVHISEVQSGRTDLTCPNCGQPLIAKKGKLKEHHFAHDGASCTLTFSKELFGLSNRLPTKLPLCIYAQRKKEAIEKKMAALQERQDFAILQASLLKELPIRLEKLQGYFQQQGNQSQAAITLTLRQQVQQYLTQRIAPFPSFNLLRAAVFRGGYTDGKNRVLPAQLNETQHEYYYPLVFQSYVAGLQQYQSQLKITQEKELLVAYQKELVRFHQFQLYFLEIQLPTALVYKIGLTTRPIDIRLKEIRQDLLGYFHSAIIKVLVLKKGVAFLEHFFKRKYASYQFSIGTLTEYFQFSPTLLDWVLRDLECVGLLSMPNRQSEHWLYWAYFHSNGKLYGGKNKYLFVQGQKYGLTSLEKQTIELFLEQA